MRFLGSLLLVLALGAVPALGDVIELKDGTRFEGEIVRTDSEYVWARVDERVRRIERSEIARLQRAGDEREDTTDAGQDADTGEPTAEKRSSEEEAQRAAIRTRVLQMLELDRPEARVRAREELVGGWPMSSDALDAALAHKTPRVRCDAIRVLTEERLGDQTDRLLAATKDTATTVRVLAVRSIRHSELYSRHRDHKRRADVEKRLLAIVSGDSAWAVVQEALRTLETVGTAGEIAPVIDAFRFADAEHRRRRIRRTLTAILGRDLGDEADASEWATELAKLARPDAPR